MHRPALVEDLPCEELAVPLLSPFFKSEKNKKVL
jgi:hypothetical protein